MSLGKPRLISPTSPKLMAFDNPFPVFPTQKSAPKTDEQIAERAMANMDINGRPSQENKRPPTAGSANSYNSVRSNQSRFPVDSRGERPPRSSEDRYGPRPAFENRGPPLRAMTMPEDTGYPANDRRAHQDPNSWQDPSYDVGGFQTGHRDPIAQRSFTSLGDRSGPIQAPPRPSTASGSRPQGNHYANQPNNYPNDDFSQRSMQAPQIPIQSLPPRIGTPQGGYGSLGHQERPPLISKGSALEAYMPDFDAQSPGPHPLHDAIGIPLDAAPEAVSAMHSAQSATPTRAPPSDAFYQQDYRARSQPDLRGQANGYAQGGQAHSPVAPRMPPMAGGVYNGQRRSPPHPLATNVAQAYPDQGNGQGSLPNSPRHFHRPGAPAMMRNETSQSGRSDPSLAGTPSMSPASMTSRSGLPDRSAMAPPKQVNPDALPINPLPVDTLPVRSAPVRAGLMQENGAAPHMRHQREVSGAAQIRQAQAQRHSMSDSTRPSIDVKRGAAVGPVTHDELFRLREAVKNNPNDQAQQLFLAKRLVEAATVLSNEGGRADARSAQKNREKFIFEAHKNIKKLVGVNYPDAMFYLADCYGTGQLGLAVDAKEAFKLYQASAKLGHPPSAYRTAVCCEMGHEAGGGTGRDPLKAVQWYRRAAALGDVPAMYKLGMILLKGLLGQQQSTGESMIWLQRAADRADDENPHALHELANLYENAPNGGKVIRDEAYAFQLYQKASKLGYRQSQTRLGKAYEYGQLGCAIDNRSSIHWYSKAAAQEDHEAELALSGWYLTGSADILKQSDSEAYLWARKSAMAETPKAEFAMGYFSETGIGCPKSLEDAKRWYGRAASESSRT
jgi:TPR repeat protein